MLGTVNMLAIKQTFNKHYDHSEVSINSTGQPVYTVHNFAQF